MSFEFLRLPNCNWVHNSVCNSGREYFFHFRNLPKCNSVCNSRREYIFHFHMLLNCISVYILVNNLNRDTLSHAFISLNYSSVRSLVLSSIRNRYSSCINLPNCSSGRVWSVTQIIHALCYRIVIRYAVR